MGGRNLCAHTICLAALGESDWDAQEYLQYATRSDRYAAIEIVNNQLGFPCAMCWRPTLLPYEKMIDCCFSCQKLDSLTGKAACTGAM